MKPAVNAFPMPDKVESALGRVQSYWQSLRRGENDIPFSDDVDPSRVPELEDQMMLVTVFENPERFRFETVGTHILRYYGVSLPGKFSDEVEERPPFDSFTQQCTATVAQRAPTHYRFETSGLNTGYARILLPTWGDGHVMMLLGAVARL
ncbi:PAS domain-containing protein [Microvirga alba]|uniref:PAS domain-containing protein n=1 Tax=Microvirga alba TaxID=2791025 RepID=A0A931FQE6_9HYPH|nr:PAS domain-containing protein [Microvirga alba]MBF9234547.1 PAS domain-containing protein [Microvirga alba]